MRVKNVFTNPVAGIRPNGIGELDEKQSKKLARYIELGMLEEVKPKEVKQEPKKESKKSSPKEEKGKE